MTKGDSSWRLHRAATTDALHLQAGGSGNPTNNVNDGAWRHVAATKSATNGLRIYIDGALADTDLNPVLIAVNDFPVLIGENAEAGNREWFGDIDEVRLGTPIQSADWIWATYQNSASNAQFNCYDRRFTDLWDLQLANLPATEIRTNSAVANVQFGASNAYWDLLVYWGSSNGGTNAAAWANTATVWSATNQPLTHISMLLGGLQASNTYYYAWRVTNCVADVWATPTELFTTLHPPPEVEHGAGAVVSGNEASLNASLLLGGPSALSLFWGPEDGATNMSAWDHVIDLGAVAPGDYSSVITGLVWGLPYYYRAYASNDSGAAWASNSVVFKSAEPFEGLKITLCGYDRASTLEDLPVLVRLGTNIPGFDYSQFLSPNGHDLRLWNSNRTAALNYEIEKWDTGGISYVWVEVPEVRSTNTCIYATWNDPSDAMQPAYA
ncbi:MAG: DUF2341 domain-containing protein, partial [Verrucomicrobiota bacterium]